MPVPPRWRDSGGGSGRRFRGGRFTLALNSIAGDVAATITHADQPGADDGRGRRLGERVAAGRIYAAAAAAAISLAGGGAAGVGVLRWRRLRLEPDPRLGPMRRSSEPDHDGGHRCPHGHGHRSSEITAIIAAAAASGGGGGAAGVGVALGRQRCREPHRHLVQHGRERRSQGHARGQRAVAVQAAVKNTVLDIAAALTAQATASQKISATVVAAPPPSRAGARPAVGQRRRFGDRERHRRRHLGDDRRRRDRLGRHQGGQRHRHRREYAQIMAVTEHPRSPVPAARGRCRRGDRLRAGHQQHRGRNPGLDRQCRCRAHHPQRRRLGQRAQRSPNPAISAAAAVSVGGGGAAGVSVSGGGAGASNVITLRTNAFVADSVLTVGGGASTVKAERDRRHPGPDRRGGGGGRWRRRSRCRRLGRRRCGLEHNWLRQRGSGLHQQSSLNSDGALSLTATSKPDDQGGCRAVSASLQGGGAAGVQRRGLRHRRIQHHRRGDACLQSTALAPPASRPRRSPSPRRTAPPSPPPSLRPASPAAVRVSPASASRSRPLRPPTASATLSRP